MLRVCATSVCIIGHIIAFIIIINYYEDHIQYRFCLVTLKFRIDATFMKLDLRTIFHIQYTRTFVVYFDSTLHVPASPVVSIYRQS